MAGLEYNDKGTYAHANRSRVVHRVSSLASMAYVGDDSQLKDGGWSPGYGHVNPRTFSVGRWRPPVTAEGFVKVRRPGVPPLQHMRICGDAQGPTLVEACAEEPVYSPELPVADVAPDNRLCVKYTGIDHDTWRYADALTDKVVQYQLDVAEYKKATWKDPLCAPPRVPLGPHVLSYTNALLGDSRIKTFRECWIRDYRLIKEDAERLKIDVGLLLPATLQQYIMLKIDMLHLFVFYRSVFPEALTWEACVYELVDTFGCDLEKYPQGYKGKTLDGVISGELQAHYHYVAKVADKLMDLCLAMLGSDLSYFVPCYRPLPYKIGGGPLIAERVPVPAGELKDVFEVNLVLHRKARVIISNLVEGNTSELQSWVQQLSGQTSFSPSPWQQISYNHSMASAGRVCAPEVSDAAIHEAMTVDRILRGANVYFEDFVEENREAAAESIRSWALGSGPDSKLRDGSLNIWSASDEEYLKVASLVGVTKQAYGRTLPRPSKRPLAAGRDAHTENTSGCFLVRPNVEDVRRVTAQHTHYLPMITYLYNQCALLGLEPMQANTCADKDKVDLTHVVLEALRMGREGDYRDYLGEVSQEWAMLGLEGARDDTPEEPVEDVSEDFRESLKAFKWEQADDSTLESLSIGAKKGNDHIQPVLQRLLGDQPVVFVDWASPQELQAYINGLKRFSGDALYLREPRKYNKRPRYLVVSTRDVRTAARRVPHGDEVCEMIGWRVEAGPWEHIDSLPARPSGETAEKQYRFMRDSMFGTPTL